MKPAKSYYSRLFKAIGQLFLSMAALFVVAQALVAALDYTVQYLFEHKLAKTH